MSGEAHWDNAKKLHAIMEKALKDANSKYDMLASHPKPSGETTRLLTELEDSVSNGLS